MEPKCESIMTLLEKAKFGCSDQFANNDASIGAKQKAKIQITGHKEKVMNSQGLEKELTFKNKKVCPGHVQGILGLLLLGGDQGAAAVINSSVPVRVTNEFSINIC